MTSTTIIIILLGAIYLNTLDRTPREPRISRAQRRYEQAEFGRLRARLHPQIVDSSPSKLPVFISIAVIGVGVTVPAVIQFIQLFR